MSCLQLFTKVNTFSINHVMILDKIRLNLVEGLRHTLHVLKNHEIQQTEHNSVKTLSIESESIA